MNSRATRAFVVHLQTAFIVSLAACVLTGQAAFAATINVTPGAGVSVNINGDCSLGEAIASANSDTQVDQCIATVDAFGDDTSTYPPEPTI